ncbi:MAG: hypothetical protein EAZ53_05645 [Bacteroidetes bacterium]|nr:MAG: hypothetical protein EAZ53_05645 [Bacteroidota bacterium]
MKVHTTNYTDTFIIADDCAATSGEVPPIKTDAKTVASLQFEMVKNNPYKYTSDDVFFQVYAERNGLVEAEFKAEREKFFSKGQPCFRTSPLTKRYGWGVHSDKNGKIAVYGCQIAEYAALAKNKDLICVKAMKSASGLVK